MVEQDKMKYSIGEYVRGINNRKVIVVGKIVEAKIDSQNEWFYEIRVLEHSDSMRKSIFPCIITVNEKDIERIVEHRKAYTGEIVLIGDNLYEVSYRYDKGIVLKDGKSQIHVKDGYYDVLCYVPEIE